MKSTFSLALLAGFASGNTQVTAFSVKSVLTKNVAGHLEITFTPQVAITTDGTITFEVPPTTSNLTPDASATAEITTDATLNGELEVANEGQVYTFTRKASAGGTALSPSATTPITIKFGPVTCTTAGPFTGVFKIMTSRDVTQVLTDQQGVRVADGVCSAVATGNGCACTNTATPAKTYLCAAGKTCHTEGTNEGTACKVAGDSEAGVTECEHTDGKTKNTAACACKAKNDATPAVTTTYNCTADQVCDIKATTAETACKARASNGSSLLLLAAFFLAMN